MTVSRKTYLDYAATTPVDPEVIRAMEPYYNQKYGNTMSIHAFGQRQSEAVEKARRVIARSLEALPEEIIFTASATESNNLAIKGMAFANQKKGKHLIISTIEHDCVMESAKWLRNLGWKISWLAVDGEGVVDTDQLKREISIETFLVSVIHGNNEMGTVQNIREIGAICKERGVRFHTDAAQSFGPVKIDVNQMNLDALTISSHKIYGPKGAAVLYLKKGTKIEPWLHGGGQENGLRSSTVNVPAIVGLAKAVEIVQKTRDKENRKLAKLRDYFIKEVLGLIEGTSLNGHPTERLPNNINISFANIEGESLLMELDRRGVEVSTGSACSSRSLEPSHVLMAMGLGEKAAHGSIRFSLGRWTTKAELDYVIKVLPPIVYKLRKISPFKS
ncbi:MAG: cysteine desulfurase family protein [Candidatus Shapirobacteria bacterium]|jgi:cysteine desulfurase